MDVTHGQSTLLSPDVAESRVAGQQPASLSLQAGRDHRRAITEPADESMYVPMSRAVGAHYANPPRSQSAPPARPYGDSSKFLRRFDGEGRQSKRHAPPRPSPHAARSSLCAVAFTRQHTVIEADLQ